MASDCDVRSWLVVEVVAITSGGDEEDVFEIVGRKKWEQLVTYQNHLFFFLALPMSPAQQIAAFNMTREAELEGKQANDFRGSVRICQ